MEKADMYLVVEGINNKDEKSWKYLYDRYYEHLCRHSMRILEDEQEVADVVQDTLIRLWRSNVRFTDYRGMTAYLYRAVTNNSLKSLRDRHVEADRLSAWFFPDEGEMSGECFSSVVREEVIRELECLIDELPDEQKRILLMSMRGMSGMEIARSLGISVNTVKQQKYRAYKFIRRHMDKFWLLAAFLFIFRKYF